MFQCIHDVVSNPGMLSLVASELFDMGWEYDAVHINVYDGNAKKNCMFAFCERVVRDVGFDALRLWTQETFSKLVVVAYEALCS